MDKKKNHVKTLDFYGKADQFLLNPGVVEEIMNAKRLVLFVSGAAFFFVIGCSRPSKEVVVLKHFAVDSMDGVITRSGVRIDKQVSSDGNGALRVSAKAPVTVRLFEVKGMDVENTRLIYQAKVRTKNVAGQVYLEMWCHFPGKGEFFSRGLQSALTGTVDWTTQETPFFLKKGEKPDYVKLNLVVNGKGTAWIDDIRLLNGPLR